MDDWLDANGQLVDFVGAGERRERATINLKGANLFSSHLEGADLVLAHLEGVDLHSASLEEADLSYARLKGSSLYFAHLENAQLISAHLEGSMLLSVHLEGATLISTHLEGAILGEVHLEGADLSEVFFNAETQLINISLGDEKYGFAKLADVRWGDTNLAVTDWASVKKLGDECEAEGRKKEAPLYWYRRAARANRQLAVSLQVQGLSEDAAHFSYRAQLMQRKVFWYQRKFVQYLFSLFIDLLAGYGYKAWRSFLAYLLVIVGFAITYHQLSTHLAWNEAIVISMTAFHGRGFFPEQFKPGDPQALVAAIEAFVGLLIEVTFIATLTQRLFGK